LAAPGLRDGRFAALKARERRLLEEIAELEGSKKRPQSVRAIRGRGRQLKLGNNWHLDRTIVNQTGAS
jgi:hypothetical protein